jgi:translation initiation factor eIF-2B subunit epsilon
MGIVRSDPFILINGDVVSNMNLGDAIAFHKEKKKVDNNAVMTVTLKAVQKSAAVVPVLDDLVVAMDRTSKQILLFDNDITSKDIRIPLDVMMDHPGVNIRTDLLDCHVDICSPELLLQFSDNFDYQNIRKHFIKNEVVNWDLGMHIYGYVLHKEYAARVQDARTYHSVSRDIIRRWVYPVVPDLPKLQDACSRAVHMGRYIYREDNVRIARSARIGNGVVLGSGTVVEENAYVVHSVLGHNCVIGAGARVEESHLWAGVRIMENSRVQSSILCDKVVVKANAVVQRGCVLAFGVVVGEGINLPQYTRLSRICKKAKGSGGADEDSMMAASPMGESPLDGFEKMGFGSAAVTDSSAHGPHSVPGPDGFGFAWKSSGGEDYMDVVESASDDEDGLLRVCNDLTGESELISGLKATSIGCSEEEMWKRSLRSAMPPPAEDSESDDDSYDGFDDGETFGGAGTGGRESKDANARENDFEKSVSEMITAGHRGGHSTENVLLEIKGLKFAENRDFGQCLRGAVPAVLDVALRSASSAGPASLGVVVAAIKAQLDRESEWGYVILENLIQNSEDEMAMVEAIENCVLDEAFKSVLHPVFRMIVQICYDSELVSEETLKRWIALRRAGVAPDGVHASLTRNWSARVTLFEQPVVQQFVEWILSEEEDSSDEDDDDDDEDEDED